MDFLIMSKKGLYSFYKTVDNNFLNTNYHLVSSPDFSLNIKDLPSHIAVILKRTKLSEIISTVETIDINFTH